MAEEDAGTPRRDPSGKTRTPHSDVGKTRTPHSDVGNNFRHKHFYRQTLLHTDAFTHRPAMLTCERVRGTRGTT